MNVQLNSVSATRKSLVVTLDATEVDAEHQAVVAGFIQQARLPGFRPGKAPAAMVAKRFGKDIAEEFKQKVVARAYRLGLEKEKLDVVNVIEVKEGEIAAGQPATVTLTLDVNPEVTLPEYMGLPTERESTEVTPAEVANVIEGLRAERADFKAVTRAAQKGDYVRLAYEGTVDGRPIAELAPDQQLYAKVPQTWEEVEGANEGALPGLGKQLAGLLAGDKKTVSIAFPADFQPLPALAGKTASYALEIQEVRERTLPPMDAEFFKAHQVESLETLQARVGEDLKRQKEYQNHSRQRRQVTDALVGKADFSAPESLVESETQAVLRNVIEENMRRGVPAEQFEKDKKELFASARQAAEKRVKLQLLLGKVAEKEKLEVSEGDLDQFIYREAARTRQKPEKIAKEMAKDRQRLRSIQESIIFDKAVDFLVSKATVKDASK